MKRFTCFLLALSVIIPLQSSSALDDASKSAIIKTIGGYICQGDTSWVACTDKADTGCQDLANAVLETCLTSYSQAIDGLQKPEQTASVSVQLTVCVHNQIKTRYKSSSGICGKLPPHLSQ
jgi:hypothetical protein